MISEYLIVNKNVLPDYFDKVVEARKLLRSGSVKEISEAVKLVGISRSTYYKYKDYVFEPKEEVLEQRMVVSMILSHEPGVLGSVLTLLAENKANIITISQSPPLGSRASLVIYMDVSLVSIEVSELINSLRSLNGVEETNILDMA